MEVLLIEEKARKTFFPSSFFFSGKVNGVRCAEIYECRMRWEARMCTFSHSRSLPFPPLFLLLCSAIISSLSYLEIEEERKGGNIDSSAYPVARQQQ